MNGYELSRKWFDFCFENPEIVKPIHSAIYFFAIEHCNRLGWKQKFGFPSQMVMEAIGVKNWRTYSKALNELVDFGFIKMIEKSKNQYSSNIIAIVKNTKAQSKALDKALSKHSTKHSQSTVSINKQYNKEQYNKYIYSAFYDSEIEKSNEDKYYKKFVKILFGDNDVKTELSGILSIKNQLTYEQFNKIFKKAKENNIKISEILLKMENDKKYYKGKTSLYLTLNNWVNNRFVNYE